MKKSTMLTIFIIYVVSIILIGFFGISIRVYDQINYVKSIEIEIAATNTNMYDLGEREIDENGNNKYWLNIYFSKAIDVNGTLMLPLNIIPKVTYNTENVADAKAESISFSLSDENYQKDGFISLSDKGELICYDYGFSFEVYVNPTSKGRNGSGAVLVVWVFM